MAKTNLQIRISSEVDAQLAQLSPSSKSAFVRRAIEEKIQREKFRRLEEAWIRALNKKDDKKEAAEAWLKAESWGPR